MGAFGFEKDILRYMKKYLTFGEWKRITTGVTQDSILGPLLLKIFLNNLFLFVSNSSLSNYTVGNTLYTFGDYLKRVKDNFRINRTEGSFSVR